MPPGRGHAEHPRRILDFEFSQTVRPTPSGSARKSDRPSSESVQDLLRRTAAPQSKTANPIARPWPSPPTLQYYPASDPLTLSNLLGLRALSRLRSPVEFFQQLCLHYRREGSVITTNPPRRRPGRNRERSARARSSPGWRVACLSWHGYFFIIRSNQPAIVPIGNTNTQMATCVVPTPSPDRVALAAASAPTARGVRTQGWG